MEIEEKYKLLKDWVVKKYNQLNNSSWLYYDSKSICLIIIKSKFKKWQELLEEGYSEDQLIDYFLEVVRVELPELKGTKLYFSMDINDEKTYEII